MNLRVVASLLVLLETSAAESVVEVTPVFWRGQDKPAFAVRCTNASAGPRLKAEYVAKGLALRLDGALMEHQPILNSFLGASEVPAGASFVFLHLLGADSRDPVTLSRPFGESVLTSWTLPLTPGRHRIAFRCWSEWSADTEFVWSGPQGGRRTRG
jgi:hypothetical protein